MTRCTTCLQPLQACRCPPPPAPDTLGRAVALQQAERARKIAAVAPLMAYAEWGMTLPASMRTDIKALCEHVYRVFFPPRPHGGRPPDLDAVQFHQCYWDAYQKVLCENVKAGKGRPKKQQVAGEMLLNDRAFYRLRVEKYRVPWPPPQPFPN
jgi:hypothetical protein